MQENIYARLREHIDRYSIGMNKTKSGVEEQLLERIFTPDEAEVYIVLTDHLEPAQEIAERCGRDTEQTRAILNRMGKKGLLFFKTLEEGRRYSLAPFMHGIYEHQAYRKDRELSTLFDRYLLGGFIPKDRSLRTVPIHMDMNADKPILPFDDIKKIILEKKKIGLFKCPCALHHQAMGETITAPTEVCMAFDFYAEFYVEEMGIGRWISTKEALDVLLKCEEAGLVHQVGGNTENTECICNCNSQCCGILRFFKLFPQPAKIAATNYFAEVNRDECTGCGTCLDRCPMEALDEKDGIAEINLDRCIGCGLCISACPTGAITLRTKPENKVFGPPQRFRFLKSSLEFAEELKK